jgi:hypothetical protein
VTDQVVPLCQVLGLMGIRWETRKGWHCKGCGSWWFHPLYANERTYCPGCHGRNINEQVFPAQSFSIGPSRTACEIMQAKHFSIDSTRALDQEHEIEWPGQVFQINMCEGPEYQAWKVRRGEQDGSTAADRIDRGICADRAGPKVHSDIRGSFGIATGPQLVT